VPPNGSPDWCPRLLPVIAFATEALQQTGNSIYDIEIQIAVRPGLVQRLVFYDCEKYAGQLRSGEPHTQLKTVVVIALLEETF
jgi:hypothetical protein